MTSSPASTTAATASPPEPEYKTLFESLGLHSNSDSVFLNAGAPGPDSLLRCSEIMQKATEHRLASGKDSYVMQYGPELGEIRYLDQLVPFLTGQYGSPVERNSLIGTAGASNGLHMTLSILYNQENPVVFVEELTYYLALGMLRPFTDKDVVAVPFRSDGIDLVAFEKLLLEHRPADWQTRQHPWALFYAIPTYHNPTGRCYSDDVLQDLVQLARKYGMLVVCDDVYNVLRYTPAKTAYGRFFGFDKKSDPDYCGSVISNGSFSKILSPGLRVGWMEVPEWFRKLWVANGVLRSGGCVNNYVQAVVASALALGLASDFLRDLRRKYGERAETVMDVLRKELPEGCSFDELTGGYFVWVTLRDGMEARAVLAECRKVSAFDGTRFCVTDQARVQYKNCMRISISYYDKAILAEAVTKLCAAVKTLYPAGN